jgi:HlyD family secretion protein
VGYGNVVESVEARGRLAAKREMSLMFTLSGVLKKIYVSVGDEVEEGALLAELDAPELQEAVEQAQYKLQEAEDELEIAELQLSLIDVSDTSPEVLSAQIALSKAGAELARAQQEYDEALNRTWEPPEALEPYSWALQLAEWDYQLAEARLHEVQHRLGVERQIQELRVGQAQRAVEQARAQVALASEQLADTLVTAPFSGIVVSMEKAAGDRVGPYEPFGAIADPSELWVVAVVPEEETSRVGVGQRATVRLDIYPDREYAGSVLQIAGQPVVWQGGAAYEVTVAFDAGQDVPAVLQAGADVVITSQAREDVLVVPNRAIITIGEKKYVELIGGGGAVERVEVQAGISSDTETEIVSGLQAGQVVRIP